MDPKFLREVQAANWIIMAADGEKLMARCPRAGCTMSVNLKPGGVIPQTCRAGADLTERVVGSFEEARLALRERRENLALTIADVEQAAGLADYHIAKSEKDDPSKIPNIETFLNWAGALGFEVVLKPAPLPLLTLRLLAETRHRVGRRVQRNEISRSRRG